MGKSHDIFEMSVEMPERNLIGRVVRAERIGPPPYGRTSFEIDAIDMSVPLGGVDAALDAESDPKPFAVIRIVTTQRRFDAILGFDRDDEGVKEGAWLQLEILPRAKGKPIAYQAQLDARGYSRLSRGSLADAQFLFRDDDIGPEPGSLSASVPANLRLAHRIAQRCAFPTDVLRSRGEIKSLLRGRGRPHAIIVRDVGQASFITAIDERQRQLFHVDAGWPIAFNGKTAPKVLPKLQSDIPVILSHWDFDHLLGFYRFPELSSGHWIVPIQNLGPGARRVSEILRSRGQLHSYSGTRFQCGEIDIVCCNGAHPMNDTGLAVTARLRSGCRVAMVGDAAYSCAKLKRPLHRLVVTHHGADFDGAVVRAAAKKSPAVVSVGRGNVYRHPRSRALSKHRNGQWSVIFTMSQPGLPRGDRIL